MSDVAVAAICETRSVAPLLATRTVVPRDFAGEVLLGRAAYDALLPEWERLARLQPGALLFQTPTLLQTWARRFARNDASLATVVLRREGRPVLIWPLLVERRALVRVVSGAGAPINQYDEILIDPGTDPKVALGFAIDLLTKTLRPDLLLLERVRADSLLRAALHDVEPFCWGEAAPFADLSRGMQAVLASRSSHTAKNQRKRIKRFEKAGRSAFAIAENALESEAWILEALALKRNWLHDTGRLSRAFIRRKTANCLADLARTMSNPDASPRMIVSRLSLDGRTAAIEAGCVHRGTYHLYLGAFAPEFAKFGPGNILAQRMLEWCVRNGIERYDMLAPRSRHKSEWQSGEVGVVDFALPMTLTGRLYASLVLKRLAPMLRRAFYALPVGARSAVVGTTLRI